MMETALKPSDKICTQSKNICSYRKGIICLHPKYITGCPLNHMKRIPGD
jgi:hypothetical protein